ncbi:unnamed protein product, partial [Nesidiocoris tenuis]
MSSRCAISGQKCHHNNSKTRGRRPVYIYGTSFGHETERTAERPRRPEIIKS